MPVDLYGRDAPPALVYMLSHLSPLGAVGQTRTEADPLPFRSVNVLTITSDELLSKDTALVSVHTFGWARTPQERAATFNAAKDTDRRIMLLAHDPGIDVTMPDTSIANLEFLELVEKSALRPYGVDDIHRYVGRYRYGLSYVAVA